MLKSKVIILSCCWLLGLASRTYCQLPAKEQKEGTATVTGRVTLNNEPIRGVMVSVSPQRVSGISGVNLAKQARTDAGGRFRLTGIVAGPYVISALAPGYVTSEGGSFGRPAGQVINISDGDNIENVELTLKRGSVITGRVTDADGRPLIEEYVSLTRLDEQGTEIEWKTGLTDLFMYQTDDRGIYRLFGLPAGRYLVSIGIEQAADSLPIGSSRKVYRKTFHPDAAEKSKAKIVVVGEGEEAADVDISVGEIKKTYEVLGRVIDSESGQPVGGVNIVCGWYRSGGGALGEGGALAGGMGDRTGAQGEFRLTNLVPGKYAVFVTPVGSSEYYSDPMPIDVVNSNLNGIEVKARRGTSINGQVVIEGVQDPAVLAKLSQMAISAVSDIGQSGVPIGAFSLVKANGSFRIAGLRPGKTHLYVTADVGQAEFSIVRLEREGRILPVSQPAQIEIGAGEQINSLRVILAYRNTVLRGELRLAGRAIPENVPTIIELARTTVSPPEQYRGEVDSRGRFFIKGLLPGDYELRVRFIRGMVNVEMDPQILAAAERFKQVVHISSGIENQITVTLTPGQQEGNR